MDKIINKYIRQTEARLLMEMNQAEAEGLRQWLFKKDISDDATIESLIEDWRARR